MAHITPIELPAPGGVSTEAGEVYFIGNATTLITYAGFTLLTDPAFLHKGDYTPLGHGIYTRREVEPACSPQDLPPLDLIILSHYHGDHFDEVAARELEKGLPIITTRHAAKQLAQLGFTNLHAMNTWETQMVKKGDAELVVTAMPARHAPDEVVELLPPVIGSMLEFSQGGKHLFRLYITGDTLIHDLLYDIPKRYPDIDLGLFHVGGTTLLGILVTMNGEQGVQAVKIVHPRVAIPIHFNDFSVFLSGLDDFKAAAATNASLTTSMHYLLQGDTYRFSVERGQVGTDQSIPPSLKPPFTRETALLKVKTAEDAWNSRDPERVALAYTPDSQWRNRTEFLTGREEIKAFLRRKWAKELDYHLMKELWCYTDNRISVRFEYEWRDADTGQWMRTHGNEHWEFDEEGLMRRRDMSGNDYPIQESERRYR